MKCSMMAALLGWFLVACAVAEPPMIAEIRLEADPGKCLAGHPGKALEMTSTHVVKFKILPGLAYKDLVSLEAVGFTDFYVRHERFVFYLQRRPRQFNPGFDNDTTFKMIQVDGDKVRFEAINYPGQFITAKDDRAVVLAKDPTPARSTFILKK
jgi:hypothetical protein